MDQLKIIPLGGIGTVTKNMYLYELGDEILIVDCGIGFVDESMPGVDLEIPDVTYLRNTNKKIVGMLLTHGHEDHIGALPFILPSLPSFPIYGTTLTAALANEKLIDFGIQTRVQEVQFGEDLSLGSFRPTFLRVTHSIIDTAHIFIRTPIGNFYHGSDYKFDFTPVDGKPSDLRKIAQFGEEGVLCLMSDCLGAERPGHEESEMMIYESFDQEFRKAEGRIFITTYSSNISRMNQAIETAKKHGRKVCFIGRSFLKARDIGRKLGYMELSPNDEIKPQDVMKMDPNKVLVLLAGSQGQVESGLVRIANDENDMIKISKGDTIIFSADPIPGNENQINALIDTLAKKQTRVVYSDITDDFHVSGHGARADLELLISLTTPQFMMPIGGTFRHMVKYREIAGEMGYSQDKVILTTNGQEIIFTKDRYQIGKRVQGSNVYVDEITGEEVDKYVIHDRIKIANEGMIIIIAEIDMAAGKIQSKPIILSKGFVFGDKDAFSKKLMDRLKTIKTARDGQSAILYYRKTIQKIAEGIMYREKREPLVIPVVVEV